MRVKSVWVGLFLLTFVISLMTVWRSTLVVKGGDNRAEVSKPQESTYEPRIGDGGAIEGNKASEGNEGSGGNKASEGNEGSGGNEASEGNEAKASETKDPALKPDQPVAPQKVTTTTTANSPKGYLDVVASVAVDNVVMLMIVDSGFLDMVVNLYMSSIKPLGIKNYLMLAMDRHCCPLLANHGIDNCVLYRDFHFTTEASKYGSAAFNKKMSERSQMIIEILEAGFTILHTDTDMFFYSNPLDDIDCPRESCHMAALEDNGPYNAGFILLHANEYTIQLYKGMIKLQSIKPKLTEQWRFNEVIQSMKKKHKGFVIRKMPKEKYQCGLLFYNQHYFADTAAPCPQCIVVHNNWVVGSEVKIYRAKEMHHWMFDKDGYYTNTTRRYLTYENPKPAKDSTNEQMRRLKRALAIGFLVNRIVILPEFHLKTGVPKPFHLIAQVGSFNAHFDGAYREHTFLTHPLVPDDIKQSVSGLITLGNGGNSSTPLEDTYVIDTLRHETAAVVKLGPLTSDLAFSDPALGARFKVMLDKGVRAR